MSQENVELARRGYEAMNAVLAEGGDVGAFVREAYDRDVVMEMGTLEGTLRGRDGVERFIRGQASIIEGLRAEPEEIIDAGDRIVVQLRLSGRAKNSGLPFEVRILHTLTLRDGRVLHLRLFNSRDKALEAVGLRE
ncbi:MAG TPA: nuclear transport factor 2 family protein [Solirubrobacteraceae bacterium]|nr:nuclear transport factor 2 family protein [Solirubrobacteraceae bacterium]